MWNDTERIAKVGSVSGRNMSHCRNSGSFRRILGVRAFWPVCAYWVGNASSTVESPGRSAEFGCEYGKSRPSLESGSSAEPGTTAGHLDGACPSSGGIQAVKFPESEEEQSPYGAIEGRRQSGREAGSPSPEDPFRGTSRSQAPRSWIGRLRNHSGRKNHVLPDPFFERQFPYIRPKGRPSTLGLLGKGVRPSSPEGGITPIGSLAPREGTECP